MSIAPLTYQGNPSTGALSAPISVRSRAPILLAGSLLILTLYAAFEHGAVAAAPEARIQVAIAVVAAFAAGAWIWSGTLRVSAPAIAAAGIGLLAAFAIWSGITLLWSVSPDHTWMSLNRALTYLIVLCLAVAVGSSSERAVELVAFGFALVVTLIAIYALGQKITPGLHIAGVFDLNRTGPLPRLQEPLGYWNALALFVAMGVPVLLGFAVDLRRSLRVRMAALCVVELIALVVAFTYSRGGALALAAGLAMGVWLSGARLRSLMWVGLTVAATIAPLLFGLLDHSLTTDRVSLGHRELAGGELGLILLVSLAALVLVGRRLAQVEQRVHLRPQRARAIGRLLIATSCVALVAAILALAFSSRGLTGSVSHAWKTFTATKEASRVDPHRLLSADSANRWVWWKEAAGAFSDRPLVGWGAGSFGVVHLLYRRQALAVQQPHSVPFQFLVETGLVGAVLALGGFGLLFYAAGRSVRRRPTGREQLLAAGLLGGAVVYAVHAFYDWDWDVPAVTLPAIVFLGVLVGERRDRFARLYGPGPGLRALAVVATSAWLCAFAFSSALPSLAASKADAALVAAGGSSAASLENAQDDASLASSLDPLSDVGPRAEATIAQHQRDYGQARRDLVDAVKRDPSDVQAWDSLALLDYTLGDRAEADQAASRAYALDPHGLEAGEIAVGFAQVRNLLAAPPRDSATAIPTP